MIDFEFDIFDTVLTEFRNYYTENEVKVASEYIKDPAFLPFVSIEESDVYSVENSMDNDRENHAVVTFDVNVYSNKITGKKREAKAISNVLDDIFISLNFKRVELRPTPNMIDGTVYRITGRYRAIIGLDGTIYRR